MKPLIIAWTAPLFIAGVFLTAPAYADDTSAAAELTQEQRQERRLLFNQYVEEEIARREREKYRAPRPERKKEKIWVARFNSLYGFDSNPNLNASHRGNSFFQETLSGSFSIPRPDLAIVPWSGKLGFSGYVDFFNYENFEMLSYQTTTLGVYSEEMVSERHQLKIAYDLTVLQYPDNNALTYYGHRIKPTWTILTSNTTSWSFFGSYELREYADRKSLDASNLPTLNHRQDDYMEWGINPKFYPSDKTYWSVTVAAKYNDSNDNYLTYGDYYGWKANVLLYQKLGGPMSLAWITGYDFKQYKGLTFSTFENGPFETQADHLVYSGVYLYYDLNTNWQWVLSYLYKQNYSNNPLMDWSGSTASLGMNLSF